MGGASNRSDDSKGGSSYSDQLKKIQKPNPIVKFIKGGGFTGAIIRSVGKKIGEINEQSRRNKLTSQFDSEEGVKRTPYATDNDRNDNNNSILSTNTAATKQVASSGIVTSTGMVAPTIAEVSQATATDASSSYSSDATLLANNKKGRRSTILAKAKGLGDSNLNTTKRTLGA